VDRIRGVWTEHDARHALLLAVATVLALAAVAAVVLEAGFYRPVLPVGVLRGAVAAFTLGGSAAVFALTRRTDETHFGVVDKVVPAVVVAGVLGAAFAEPGAFLTAQIGAVLSLFAALWRVNAFLSRRLPDPAVLFPLSFLLLIAAGTLLIKLPVCVPPGERLRWVDAVFTMTSAVCITGLSVVDTATFFTPTGKFLIILFVQLGGLGVILFGSTLAMLLGARLTLRENVNLSHALGEYPAHRVEGFARFVVAMTLAIELLGAALLYVSWPPDAAGQRPPPGDLAAACLFHSVSAFCNAGIDLTGASMIPLRDHPAAHLVIAPLVAVGGLGFIVLQELWRRARAALRPGARAPTRRLSLHTRIVLVTSLALYAAGVLLIFASQAFQPETPPSLGPTAPGVVPDVAGAGRGVLGNLLDAHFLSVNARSGGLTTVPMHEVHPGARFVLALLMFVGGSPGGTAGGIKTTAFALLVLAVVATLRRREETEAARRAISDVFVKRAAAIAFTVGGLIAAVTFALTMIEDFPLEPVLFEAISAATTTGLSLGVTPLLSDPSKYLVAGTMFLGRIGPLALFGSVLFVGTRRPRYGYPHEPVALG